MSRPIARDPRSLPARTGVRPSVHRAGYALALLVPVLLVACDIPTGLPKWDTTFVVQSENTTLAAAQLLPASVTIVDETFAVSAGAVQFSQDLAGLCASCLIRGAQSGPRPAFLGSFESTIGLPADVMGVALVSGRVNVSMQNSFGFDLLRTDADTGSLAITVRSGSNVVGTHVITGATHTLPPGGSLLATVPIKGVVNEKLSVEVAIRAPAGSDADQSGINGKLDVTATPGNLRASTARLRIDARHITATPVQLNLASLDKKIINATRSGAILLSISNPLGISGQLTLKIVGGATTVSKPVTIETGDSNVEVPLDAKDLRAFLGHDVSMTIAGSVSAADDVTLTPTQVLTVASRLKLVIGWREQ